MVFIFAKTADDALAGLVKQVDALAVAEEKLKLAGVVNIVGAASPEANEKLKQYGEKLSLKKTPLALSTDGEKFKINPAAEVTVLIYRGKKVKFNYAWNKGELNAQGVAQVIADTKKVLAEPPEEPPAKPKDAKTSAKDKDAKAPAKDKAKSAKVKPVEKSKPESRATPKE